MKLAMGYLVYIITHIRNEMYFRRKNAERAWKGYINNTACNLVSLHAPHSLSDQTAVCFLFVSFVSSSSSELIEYHHPDLYLREVIAPRPAEARQDGCIHK